MMDLPKAHLTQQTFDDIFKPDQECDLADITSYIGEKMDDESDDKENSEAENSEAEHREAVKREAEKIECLGHETEVFALFKDIVDATPIVTTTDCVTQLVRLYGQHLDERNFLGWLPKKWIDALDKLPGEIEAEDEKNKKEPSLGEKMRIRKAEKEKEKELEEEDERKYSREIERKLAKISAQDGDELIEEEESEKPVSHDAKLENASVQGGDELIEEESKERKKTEKHFDTKLENAKKVIRKILVGSLQFTDPTSNVSAQRLLMLIWRAINDETNRVRGKTLLDAKKALVYELHAIYVTYSLDKALEEDKSIDVHNRFADIFTHIIDGLRGFHVHIPKREDNAEVANIEFIAVVKKEITRFLADRVTSVADFDAYVSPLRASNGVVPGSAIWDKTKEEVFLRMSELFSNTIPNKVAFDTFAAAQLPTIKVDGCFKDWDRIRTQIIICSEKKYMQGIQEYKENRSITLGFFSFLFDRERGLKRAKIFSSLLEKQSLSSHDRNIILFALLSNSEGPTLKKDVAKSLGFKDAFEGANYFDLKIKKKVKMNAEGILVFNEEQHRKVIGRVNQIQAFVNADPKEEEITAWLAKYQTGQEEAEANKKSPLHRHAI